MVWSYSCPPTTFFASSTKGWTKEIYDIKSQSKQIGNPSMYIHPILSFNLHASSPPCLLSRYIFSSMANRVPASRYFLHHSFLLYNPMSFFLDEPSLQSQLWPPKSQKMPTNASIVCCRQLTISNSLLSNIKCFLEQCFRIQSDETPLH